VVIILCGAGIALVSLVVKVLRWAIFGNRPSTAARRHRSARGQNKGHRGLAVDHVNFQSDYRVPTDDDDEEAHAGSRLVTRSRLHPCKTLSRSSGGGRHHVERGFVERGFVERGFVAVFQHLRHHESPPPVRRAADLEADRDGPSNAPTPKGANSSSPFIERKAKPSDPESEKRLRHHHYADGEFDEADSILSSGDEATVVLRSPPQPHRSCASS